MLTLAAADRFICRFAAVYDGHEGSQAAAVASSRLHEHILRQVDQLATPSVNRYGATCRSKSTLADSKTILLTFGLCHANCRKCVQGTSGDSCS